MAEKTEASNISIESSKKLISCNIYRLKLPNFFTLPDYKGNAFDISSPTFTLDKADWCFRFYSCEKIKVINEKSDIANVDLVRLKKEETEHKLFYKITLLDTNDKKYVNYSQTKSDVCYFFEDDCEYFLMSFDNEVLSSDGCETLTVIVHLFKFESIQVKGNRTLEVQDSSDRLAVETKDCKISLKLSTKTLSSNVYTLILPTYTIFQKCKEKTFAVSSPMFEFANATWCFQFHSPIASVFTMAISVDFVRIQSEKAPLTIFVKCNLLEKNGEIYDTWTLVYDSKADDENKQNQIEIICGWNFFHESDTLTFTFDLLCDESLEVDTETMPNIIDRAREDNQKSCSDTQCGPSQNLSLQSFDLLSQDLKQLLINGENYDLTLKVSEKEFRVHQAILKVRSHVFKAMLTHDMIEKNKGVIDVPDCDPQVMEQLLIYVYSGKVESLNQDNVLGLYYAADKYNLTLLKEKCTRFMKESLSTSIICDVIQLALNHSDTTLLECATEYFVHHINDILPTVGWMSFMKSNSIAANELFMKASKKCSCGKS